MRRKRLRQGQGERQEEDGQVTRLGNGALACIAAAAGFVLLAGCAAGSVVKQRVADRAVETAQWYCSQPRTARSILRVEANKALEGEAKVVIACHGDDAGEYDALQLHFIDPLGAATVDRLLLTVIEKGAYTLPDGRTLRVVVDE